MNLTEKKIGIKLLEISSPAFKNGEMIPEKYTCDGLNTNPPLKINGIPADTVCLSIILNDPDAPIGVWVHWLVWNIPVTNLIRENETKGVAGLNDFQEQKYDGPCPHSGTHRYFFKIYALDTLLHLPLLTRQSQLEKAMQGHIIGSGELMGLYTKKK